VKEKRFEPKSKTTVFVRQTHFHANSCPCNDKKFCFHGQCPQGTTTVLANANGNVTELVLNDTKHQRFDSVETLGAIKERMKLLGAIPVFVDGPFRRKTSNTPANNDFTSNPFNETFAPNVRFSGDKNFLSHAWS